MKKAELDSYRKLLLGLRDRCNGDLSQLAGEAMRGQEGGNGTNAAADPADQGSESFEHEFNLSLLENEEEVLEQIGKALKRLDKGTFGACESCGQPIPKERLQLLPYTPHCVACARKMEKRS